VIPYPYGTFVFKDVDYIFAMFRFPSLVVLGFHLVHEGRHIGQAAFTAPDALNYVFVIAFHDVGTA